MSTNAHAGAAAPAISFDALLASLEAAGEVTRLRLAEDFRELHNAVTAAGGQGEQPQPGWFSDRAQTGEEALHGFYLT